MDENRTVQLHRAQLQFRQSLAPYRGYVGGRGAGKSWIGTYDLLRRAKPGRLYALYAPTYPLLRDTTLRSLLLIAKQFNFLREYKKGENQVVLGNGAEVICRSLDDPETARGPNLSGALMDEASLMDKLAFEITIASLRECGEQGWMTCTFTPKGRQHWTYDVFGKLDRAPGAELFHSRTRDNPFLPPGFEDLLRGQYGSAFAQQELEGLFVDLQGAMINRGWFPVIDDWPREAQLIRYWDLAATRPKKGKDPDYTVGALVGLHEGRWFIIDIQRFRDTPYAVEQRVLQAAMTDGHEVPIRMEQEGGASGVSLIDSYARKVLVGWDFKGVKPSTAKDVRAAPWAAAAEAGNVSLVQGAWVKDFLDEVELFPDGDHDDQVDAVSGATEQLGLRFINPHVYSGGDAGPPIDGRIDDEIEKLLAGMEPAERMEAERILREEG